MKVIFAKTREEAAEALRSIGSAHRGDAQVVPLMPKAALELQELGLRDVSLPIEMLGRDEREKIGAQAIDLSKSWYRGPELAYMGIDLLDCCRLQMLGFFQDLITAEKLVPIILDRYSPNKAVFFRHPSMPSFGHSMHDGSADIFEAVLQWRFSREGIPVEIIPKKEAKPVQKKPGAFFKRALLKVKRAVSPRTETKSADHNGRQLAESDFPADREVLIGFGAGYDLLVIWPYLKALSRSTGGFPVLINEASSLDLFTLRSGLAVDDDFRYIPVTALPMEAGAEGTLKDARAHFFSSLGHTQFISGAMQNPLLSFQYELLWDALIPQALNAARAAKLFFARHPTLLYLDDNCAGPSNRAWASAGQMSGVRAVTVQHGALNLLEFFDFTHDLALTQGEVGKRSLQSAYPDRADRVVSSGDPSMEGVRRNAPPASDEGPRNRVILLTGGFLHQVWTDMDFDGFTLTWQGLMAIADNHRNLEFIIKPHPSVRDLGYWYRDMVKKAAFTNVKVIEDQKLEDLLPGALLAVLVGKPGTAGLVTILHDVPFVYLDTMLCRRVKGYDVWTPENGVPRLTATSEVETLLQEIERDADVRHRLLAENRCFSGLYLNPFDSLELAAGIGLPAEE